MVGSKFGRDSSPLLLVQSRVLIEYGEGDFSLGASYETRI
jgi:hypothetical protein